jgi:signal transduction histidine kinase
VIDMQSTKHAPVTSVVAALLALAALVAVPWVVSRRLTTVRHELIGTTVRARRLVHDTETALLLEVASRGEPALARVQGDVVTSERAREAALVALTPRLGGDVARELVHLRALTYARWRAARHRGDSVTAVVPPPGGAGVRRPAGDGASGDSATSLAEVFAAAERLDTALAVREAQESARVQSLEAWDVILPAVLVPILLGIILAVYWIGRRMASLADEAERSRLALAQAAEQKVALLRGLAHDLKNTLWAATGFAALLRDEIVGPLTPTQRDHLTRIGRLVDQAITAVTDTLEIARADAGTLPVSRRRIDLRALLSECASDYVARANAAGLVLATELSPGVPPLETDPSHVAKIVGNLLSNAIKYTPAGGHVRLIAAVRSASNGLAPGAWIAIEVSDTGPGVPAAFRDRVFDEFFRMPDASTVAAGTGVGLAMSRRVARALGGEITMGGEEGCGAICTLWLPAPASDVGAVRSGSGSLSRAAGAGYRRAPA